MFQKPFELCDVVSVLLQQHDTGHILMTGILSPPGSVSPKKMAANLFRFPCVKVVNEEWTQTANELALTILGKPNKSTLFKLYKVWIPMHVQRYIYHVVYLVNVQKDGRKKSRGINFKVSSATTCFRSSLLITVAFAVDEFR